MNKPVLLTATALFALSLASCAPRYNPYAPKPDAELSCQEIRDEIARWAEVVQASGAKVD